MKCKTQSFLKTETCLLSCLRKSSCFFVKLSFTNLLNVVFGLLVLWISITSVATKKQCERFSLPSQGFEKKTSTNIYVLAPQCRFLANEMETSVGK